MHLGWCHCTGCRVINKEPQFTDVSLLKTQYISIWWSNGKEVSLPLPANSSRILPFPASYPFSTGRLWYQETSGTGGWLLQHILCNLFSLGRLLAHSWKLCILFPFSLEDGPSSNWLLIFGYKEFGCWLWSYEKFNCWLRSVLMFHSPPCDRRDHSLLWLL